jgi:hypothetical protein
MLRTLYKTIIKSFNSIKILTSDDIHIVAFQDSQTKNIVNILELIPQAAFMRLRGIKNIRYQLHE